MATDVFSCFHDPSKKVSSGSKLATLLVPDGHWFIVGKVILDNDNTTTYETVTGKLIAGAGPDADWDTSYVGLNFSGAASDISELAFTVVHTFPGDSNQAKNPIDLVITLDPDHPTSLVHAVYLKITAIRVDSIVNKGVAP